VRTLLLLLLLAAPVQAQYPPESQPLMPPERVLSALGLLLLPDEPLIVADAATIDILCVTATSVSSSLCQQGVNRITTTINNSGQGQVTVRLVGILPVVYGGLNAGEDLWRLTHPADGFMDAAHTERDRLGADTVLLIGNSSDSCGVAYLNSTASSAFAYVFKNCISNSSFEHEWGHNVGMAHDLPNASAPAFPYGVGWCFGNGRKDVLTYPSPCGGNRAPFYSNPDVFDGVTPTGTATANNARVLRERAGTIAAFRPTVIMPVPRSTGKPILTED
jgi:hypothetical protein